MRKEYREFLRGFKVRPRVLLVLFLGYGSSIPVILLLVGAFSGWQKPFSGCGAVLVLGLWVVCLCGYLHLIRGIGSGRNHTNGNRSGSKRS